MVTQSQSVLITPTAGKAGSCGCGSKPPVGLCPAVGVAPHGWVLDRTMGGGWITHTYTHSLSGFLLLCQKDFLAFSFLFFFCFLPGKNCSQQVATGCVFVCVCVRGVGCPYGRPALRRLHGAGPQPCDLQCRAKAKRCHGSSHSNSHSPSSCF